MKIFFGIFIIFLALVILFVAIPALLNDFNFGSGLSRKAGVFKSSDSGASWNLKANTNKVFQKISRASKKGGRPINTATIGVAIAKDHPVPTKISNTNSIFQKEILDIIIDPEDSKNIYLGTKGAGLVTSFDAGETWAPVIDSTKQLDPRAIINKVLVDPKDHRTIYLSVFQKNYGMVLRSDDRGYSFEVIYTAAKSGQRVTALALNLKKPNLIYLGTSEGDFFESNNYGDSWRVLRSFDARVRVIVISAKTNSIYIGTERGLFRTDDRGKTFTELNKKFGQLFSQTNNILSLAIDRSNSNIIYFGTQSGLFRSTDGGSSFSLVEGLMSTHSWPVRAIEISPIDSKIIYVGAGSLIYKSTDAGRFWSVEKLPTNLNIQVIKVNPNSPKEIYLGVAE